jgi:hypothetical protein
MDRTSSAERRARWRFTWLCLALLVALGLISCSPHITQPPLPELHIPGVSKVPGFDSFFKTVDVYPHDELGRFTAYQPGGQGQPGHLLLPLGGKLYDIGLDGKLPHTVPLPNACFDRPSVTLNGRWLLCSNTDGVIALDLQSPSPGNVEVALADQTRPGLATFAPDSRRFIVTQFADKDCELGVFASGPPYDSSRLVIGLLFPNLVAPGHTTLGGFAQACDVTDVSWSPDGNWIAFIAGRPGADVNSHLYALDLHTIALPLDPASDSAKVIPIPSSAVHDLGPVIRVGDIWANLSWPKSFDTVSMPAGNQTININLRTGERHAILSVADAEICAASWTPDGAQFFFALCRPYHGNPDITAPPPELYVYTP